MRPQLVCIIAVTRIIHFLLRIHVDGWKDNYDQWVEGKALTLDSIN